VDFKVAFNEGAVVAETPIWDPRVRGLYWTDLFPGDIYLFSPGTGEDRMVFKGSEPIGSAVPCDDENFLLAAYGSGIVLVDLTTGETTPVAHPGPPLPGYRYNDTRVDAAGRIFTSTVANCYKTPEWSEDMRGNFYMIDTDGSVHTVVADILQYNAIVWNEANTKMYVVDTHSGKLLVFDYDIGQGPVSGPETLVDFEALGYGMADGVSIDSEGRLYVCHWTQCCSVWDEKGALVEKVDFPVPYVTCGGFGGDDLTDFYVASSNFGYSEEEMKEYPGAGGVFRAKSPVKGTLDHFYLTKNVR
jgi:sugar lactone lactonase YvrE